MNRLLVSAAALALLSGAAMAADVPEYVPPPEMMAPVPMAYNWSGFYVGVHAGYGWGDDDDAFVGGGQAGYRWQFNTFVLGVEGDVSWSELTEDYHTVETLRLSTGFAFDRFHAYLTGGAAAADFDEFGWVIGGGAEYGFTQNVSAGLEYLHYDIDGGDADVVRARLNFKFGGF
jgi:outer membrane immunogenic protein